MVLTKKSQTPIGQIFVYLLSLFVVAIVLVFGYRSISNLREKGKEADYLQFKSELEAAVKLNEGYGDESNEVFSIPEGYKEACFVSYYIQPSATKSDFPASYTIPTPYQLIKNSVDSKVKKNIFLVKNNNEIDSFFIDNVKVKERLEPGGVSDDNFGCITAITGKLKIKFEGEGDKTLISTS